MALIVYIDNYYLYSGQIHLINRVIIFLHFAPAAKALNALRQLSLPALLEPGGERFTESNLTGRPIKAIFFDSIGNMGAIKCRYKKPSGWTRRKSRLQG